MFDRRDDRPGWPVCPEHLAAIADAGFTAVRLPVRWWGRADELLAPVRELVDAAWAHGLAVVVTMHHADAVYQDPVGSAAPLTALWRRIAGALRRGWRRAGVRTAQRAAPAPDPGGLERASTHGADRRARSRPRPPA